MAYFMLVLAGGHVGTGKYYEHTRFVEASNAVSAWMTGKFLPRIKGITGILLVKPITKKAYIAGKERESEDPYLLTRK
jgi:hypothetical protein